jgi:hypothetical protein
VSKIENIFSWCDEADCSVVEQTSSSVHPCGTGCVLNADGHCSKECNKTYENDEVNGVCYVIPCLSRSLNGSSCRTNIDENCYVLEDNNNNNVSCVQLCPTFNEIEMEVEYQTRKCMLLKLCEERDLATEGCGKKCNMFNLVKCVSDCGRINNYEENYKSSFDKNGLGYCVPVQCDLRTPMNYVRDDENIKTCTLPEDVLEEEKHNNFQHCYYKSDFESSAEEILKDQHCFSSCPINYGEK